MRSKIFTLLIICSVAFVGGYILSSKDKIQVSSLEQRNLAIISELTPETWTDGSFQKSVENTLADHFIARNIWIKTYKSMENAFNRFSFAMIRIAFGNTVNDKVLSQPVSNGINVVEISNIKYLIREPYLYDEDIEKHIMKKIDEINLMSKQNSDVEFYVYLPLMAHDISFFDIQSVAQRYIALFENLTVPFEILKISDIYEYKDNFFKTDHHWNHRGAYKGYRDIVRLLFSGKSLPIVPVSEEKFENINFYGSHARSIGFSLELEGDELYGYRYNLPRYELYIDGVKTYNYGHYKEYENGTVIEDKEFDHYNYLNERRRAEIIFKTNRRNLDNALIISDSMSNPIRELIASHFNDSIFINLETYNAKNQEFDITEYLRKYKIGKVLIMDVLSNYYPDGEMKYLEPSEQ